MSHNDAKARSEWNSGNSQAGGKTQLKTEQLETLPESRRFTVAQSECTSNLLRVSKHDCDGHRLAFNATSITSRQCVRSLSFTYWPAPVRNMGAAHIKIAAAIQRHRLVNCAASAIVFDTGTAA